MAEHPHTERNTVASHSLRRGILLGLLPLFIFIFSIIMTYLVGYCGSGLIVLVQYIAIALWGIELLAGVFCLFNMRLRSLAISLILTLLLSALLSWSLDQLSLSITSSGPPFFCHFRN